jgi:hypothetical protein
MISAGAATAPDLGIGLYGKAKPKIASVIVAGASAANLQRNLA